ncbi:MAG: hypothetical protein ACP5JY_02675 [Candidatus Nanoarchaeia archaeon]
MAKHLVLLIAVLLAAIVAASGCVQKEGGTSQSGISQSGFCQTNNENVSCRGSFTKTGDVTISVSKLPVPDARLGEAYLSQCEIGERLWFCKGSTACEVVNEKEPFKVHCPISEGPQAVSFKFKTTIKPGKELETPGIANCASTPEGMYDCELTLDARYYFKA